MPRPSRSLFASLPWDLKKTIRTKAEELEELVNTDDIDVKAELIRGVADDLLPTQPSSPQLLPADEEEESMNLKPPSAPATVEPSPATPRPPISEPVVSPVTPAGSSKRPHVEVRESSTPTSLIQPARKRKRKSKAAGGVHADHPWDCTGLVPRYTDASQVPDRIRKCESTLRLVGLAALTVRFSSTSCPLPALRLSPVAHGRYGLVQRHTARHS